ncbi:Tm-1-like ATP-binding domain-containing protein [Roseiconus lacunae]|uniref:Tm-1-like ATP-binding domain-containing protein n=1 Tax=Roseiconus lacunae TaxID=2605694 RepID=UPI001E4C0B8C|nr:Tm-1-like ATP-binding domain-containing protein [Roseiconus lacunae]MCD0463119.1 Tm-1-like ATP-binding domain-containing protein [Roseiconus lacunae]
MATITVLGTLDSKGSEHAFVAEQIRQHGHTPLLIDVGTYEPPDDLRIDVKIDRHEVARAGGIVWSELESRSDRGECVAAMTAAAPLLLQELYRQTRIQGVISLGGSGGTAIATAAMRALPIGFPKVMVSTMASGNIVHYVGTKDIVMIPSIVDIAGLNRVSRMIFTRAAGAICGMVESDVAPDTDDRPLIVASMFGNTTECIAAATPVLEEAGYEVLVFHATGAGGRAMESLIESGMVAGVLDITTTEWADELVGGILSAGPHRLEAAAKAGVPAIVVPGCLDMVNFGEQNSVPPQFANRRFYAHNPQVTLMRTSREECRELGRVLAQKINPSSAPVSVLIPRKAISVISAEGGHFHDPNADQALFESLANSLRDDIPVHWEDRRINDPEFAQSCAKTLLRNIQVAAQRS